jgi:ABC-type transport system substrate-binding protein
LDPASSYTSDEAIFTAQIYEPPLQYHYLKRPYELTPLTATAIPKPTYIDSRGRPLPKTAKTSEVAESHYDIRIRPGIYYQPHPAFANDATGKPYYRPMSRAATADKYKIADFKHTGTKELTAEDYVYQIKRLAHPRLHSPIYGHMSEYIIGLKKLSATLKQADDALRNQATPENTSPPWLDLRQYSLSGVEVLDRYTYRIRIKGKYPQFVYWLAMAFFAPVPAEVDEFYAQPGMAEKNLSLNWWPVGTGHFMLQENDPNRRMVLVRNPNFHTEYYPVVGETKDWEAGYLNDMGKTLPFIDKLIFTLEKESIPYWNKFLQGYYDSSGISSDTYDQAIKTGVEGDSQISDEMARKGITLKTSLSTSIYYLGFNWLDNVVGGGHTPQETERARKLRQAISIALDYEEYISIFANGRALAGTGPLAPGIFGYPNQVGDDEAVLNPIVYEKVNGRVKRKSIESAKKLLSEAGYPNGIDQKTGQPLILNLDTTTGGASDKPRFDWYRKQFAKLGIQLEIRATDWNRFQEKIRKGNAQLFFLGWMADYPDPENFLFLLSGEQRTAKGEGENKANYLNPEFDRLFVQMKNLENGPERQAIIERMVRIVQEDAPWVFAFYPKKYGLYHGWLQNAKPNEMARNEFKYLSIDPHARAVAQARWNQPIRWPLWLCVGTLLVLIWPLWRYWQRHQIRTPRIQLDGGNTP